MNMPDGWNDLSYWADKNRALVVVPKLNEALALMKEMAEVLERIKKCCDRAEDCELTGISNAAAVDIISGWIDEPLNKFKEWK